METVNKTNSELLTEKQAAKRVKVKPQTLAVWRSRKRYNLPYVKVGGLVRYYASDVEAWLVSRTVLPMADVAGDAGRAAAETLHG